MIWGAINPSDIQLATLRLYRVNSFTGNTLVVNESTDTWNEVTVTWNNAPTVGPVIATDPLGASGTWQEVPVTNYVKSQTDGKVSFSLFLQNGTYNWADYSSREGTNPPELVIEIAGNPLPPDTIPPTATITSPTTSGTYTAISGSVDIGGTASDIVGVTQVTWLNDRGGSGTASGTTSWSVSGIALQSGDNVITVTARDAANNTGTDILTVTYTPDTISPTATITSPTTSGTLYGYRWKCRYSWYCI